MDEPWHAYAACRDADVALFFEPDTSKGQRRGNWSQAAKAYCMTCPVRAECLAEGLARDDRWGVWGGLTYGERVEFRASLAAN